MPKPIKNESLREYVLASIGSFLYKEGFQPNSVTQDGILEAINLISDYHEEGTALFPEVIITNSLDFFKTIPNKELIISEGELSIEEFRKAIKLCAPLAIDSWVIFIEITENRIKYGLVSAEMTETSLSMYNQTVGELKVEYAKTTIAYIRNIGQKTVELAGLNNVLTVSLTLDIPTDKTNSEVKKIAIEIASNCEEKYRNIIETFLEKTILNALRIGHGNLIGIVEDSEDSLEALKSENNGTYLPMPIDFMQLIIEAEEDKSNESSINLKSYSSILKSMLNHDGITIFTNKGKLIGYHLLIGNHEKEGQTSNGGARSKAYQSMQNCNLFISCFYKSQDGNMKIWNNE
ncbi:hypothetical protein [Flavobacterium yafengii]|uniref:hypothetical protein n=1 Tax=Flavobacterium yafengii TaxID=3041253 RepID=UPI0024A7E262|nr:hypothetical protein [Flavobacterium yafengii]MDI6047410.1 hypothetical protein [Flavobacterium yafengii]